THQWGTQPEMFGPRHEHRLSMIVKEVNRLGKSVILDAAVGLGQLATRLQAHGHVVRGLDYSFDAALHARRQGLTTVVGDMTKLPFLDGAFDLVTTGETLEHLDDDAAAAREIGRVVNTGGHVVATVPALKSLWSASDDYYEHRRRYSRGQLVALFKEAFAIEKAKFWGFPVVLAYDTIFLLPMNKRRARKRVDEDAALRSIARAGRARAAVRLVRAVFSLDRLFGWIPFGPGLLLVARRR
ncbi:MAG TPA: class I SAM-dependent methyltransferase, partial [Thermoanaerobaculia bacterium]